MLYIIEDLSAWRTITVCTQMLLACYFLLDPTVLFNIEKLNMTLYYKQSEGLWWAYVEFYMKKKLE